MQLGRGRQTAKHTGTGKQADTGRQTKPCRQVEVGRHEWQAFT